MLWSRVLADVIVICHVAYFSFIVFGMAAILLGVVFRWSWVRNIWFRSIHLVAIGIVVAEALAGLKCPLTVWEKQLRVMAGQASYAGDFLGHWAHQLIFYRADPRVYPALYLGIWHGRCRCVRACAPAPADGRVANRPAIRSDQNSLLPTNSIAKAPAWRAISIEGEIDDVVSADSRSEVLDVDACPGDSRPRHGLSTRALGEKPWLSPFVKRLGRPEKYLYLFCVDADAQSNDFLAVIDVERRQCNLRRTILHTVDLGTKGNETHHFGYTDDRTRIWAGGLFSSRIWILDVATDPARPRIERMHRRYLKTTRFVSASTATTLPRAGCFITFLGSASGGLPAGMAEFTNDGRFIRRLEQPADAPYGYDVAVKLGVNRMVTSSFTPLRNYEKPLAKMDLKDFGRELVVWDYKARKPIQVGKTGLAPLEVQLGA